MKKNTSAGATEAIQGRRKAIRSNMIRAIVPSFMIENDWLRGLLMPFPKKKINRFNLVLICIPSEGQIIRPDAIELFFLHHQGLKTFRGLHIFKKKVKKKNSLNVLLLRNGRSKGAVYRRKKLADRDLN